MHAGSVVIEAFRQELVESISNRKFRDVDRLLSKLDTLQEQPQLLDPYLQSLINPVAQILTETLHAKPLEHFSAELYKVLYTFTKIRGAKVVVKFLPNDVYLLDRVTCCLASQSATDLQLWQARYILLLWLSLICMAPFALKIFDDATNAGQGIVERLLQLAEQFLEASGKERESAGLLIARLLTRKDVSEDYIPVFLMRTMTKWSTPDCSINYKIGLLTCFSEIYKIGNRDLLVPHVSSGFEAISHMDESSEFENNSLLRKLRVKLAQRLALTVLTPNRASWRYNNDLKSLTKKPDDDVADEQVQEAPEVVEQVIGILLEGLQDKDTIVRYSAAKGVGRVASRIPKAFAAEVIAAISDLLKNDIHDQPSSMLVADLAKETTWNGCCLAMAELCRNGALMPEALRSTLPLVFLAIQFDIKKGTHSVGTSVRDAACYVVWSILRCYASHVLRPYLEDIAAKLIVVAMFDREVSVRRAASAAFQEGVGRHPDGGFPDGIAVLSRADFFSVGQRRLAFLAVAPAVYAYSSYQAAIMNQLLRISCRHWDLEVRQLAGESLKEILISNSAALNDIVKTSIDALKHLRSSIEFSARHGSFLAAAELCDGLVRCLEDRKLVASSNVIPDDLLLFGGHIPPYFLSGPQAPLMYASICHFIKNATNLELASLNHGHQLPDNSERRHAEQMKLAIEALAFGEPDLRAIATAALAALFQMPDIDAKICEMFRGTERQDLFDTRSSAVEKGWLEFLGQIHYSNHLHLLLTALQITQTSATIKHNSTRDDPKTRQIAVRSLGHLAQELAMLSCLGHEDSVGIDVSIRKTLSLALRDYTVDSRGDVGSWVREAALLASSQYLVSYQTIASDSSDASALVELLVQSLRQCLGKIDNLRINATSSLVSTCECLTTKSTRLPNYVTAMCASILPVLSFAVSEVERGEPSTSLFQNLITLLGNKSLKRTLIEEYLISGSSGSHSTMSAASSALLTFLESQSESYLVQVLDDMVDILTVTQKEDDRVLVPVLQSTADLFESLVFNSISSYDYLALFNAIQASCMNSRNVAKVTASLSCYAVLGCVNHAAVRDKAWRKLTTMLVHKFSRIRVVAAEKLYQVLSTLELEDSDAELVSTLTMHDWSQGYIDAGVLDQIKSFSAAVSML